MQAVWHPALRRMRLFNCIALTILGYFFLCSAGVKAAPGDPPRCDWSQQEYTDFYTPPDAGLLALEQPGEPVRVEHVKSYSAEEVAYLSNLPSSAYGAELYRILYISRSADGTPAAVSGLLAIPVGAKPEGGFPLLVFGHGTTGTADLCAPSKKPLLSGAVVGAVAHGFVVSATDYLGLGTPGPHPYGIGEPAGISMLDSARAAQRFCDSARGFENIAGNQVILAGHSQGGQSALFAHKLWKSYAPELEVKGTVVFAPAAEFRFLANRMSLQTWTPTLVPFALGIHARSQYYGAPASLTGILKAPYDTELPQRAEESCTAGLTAWLGLDPEGVFTPDTLSAIREERWNDLGAWTDYIDLDEPGDLVSELPILVVQGDYDNVVPLEASNRLVDRLCRNGNAVDYYRYPTAGHFDVLTQGGLDAVAWAEDRLAGIPPAAHCTNPEPPATIVARRGLEPVVLTGAQLENLIGAPLAGLRVYAYHGRAWHEAPMQVDEITASGIYTPSEDGLLDANDELVFMVKDMGHQIPDVTAAGGPLAAVDHWYQVQAVDPLSPTAKGWAYVALVEQPPASPSQAYVSFDPLARSIHGETYSLGLSRLRLFAEVLTLGNGPDILDRTKFRIDCDRSAQPLLCPYTESKLVIPANWQLLKKGPVRVVLYNGDLVAYGSLIEWRSRYQVQDGFTGPVRLSTDFNEAAIGATLYNAAADNGMLVDGEPDYVPPQPASAWWQLSTETGAAIQVYDLQAIGRDVATYYVDDANRDFTDTGDLRRYGEVGLQIATPTNSVTFRSTYYLLPDLQPNRGQGFAQFFDNPIQLATEWQTPPQTKLFLPVVRQ